MSVNTQKRFEAIKEHFEKEAIIFDTFFFKVMPRYQEMMQALVEALPFKKNDRLKIIDLGCGTGNLSKKLTLAFPQAKIICLDLADTMIKMAKAKLKTYPNVSFWLGDIRRFDYKGKYDLIVASMVLHHIDNTEKLTFYRKLHNALSKRGVFFCIDIFLSSNSHIQKLHMDKWKAFMKGNNLPKAKIDDMIRRHQREDRPVEFKEELSLMQRAGFKSIDVVLKHYNCALYGATK